MIVEVSLPVTAGSFFALLGASGSGKTTLLRLVGGYQFPSKGCILINGQDVTRLPAERRRVGMVFQSYALFPHLSARDNVGFGLDVRGVSRAQRQRQVEAALDRVGVDLSARNRKPMGLSGGQQQRVALARALVIEPEVLLLDEPLANLDCQLREQVRGELRDLQRRTGVTTLLVTHDQEEALALADGIGVMAGGRLLQVGTPEELYHRPCCPSIALLLGAGNILHLESFSDDFVTLAGGMQISRKLIRSVTVTDVLFLRPGGILPGSDFHARVAQTTFRGDTCLVELFVHQTRLLTSCLAVDRPHVGETVGIAIVPDAIWVFPQTDLAGNSS